MARREVLVCDLEDDTCEGVVTCYKLWRDGDRQAWARDLCEHHASPLLAIVDGADKVDLPSKQRVRMEPTRLRTTDKTKPFKK